MSVYSREHRFIFIHIPKNAGSTFIRNLEPSGMVEGFEELNARLGYGRDPALGNHFTYQMIADLVDRHGLPIDPVSWFKFCIVRNPWERMVSLYQHRMRKIDMMTNGVPRNTPEDKALLREGFTPWLLNTKNQSDRVLAKMPQVSWIRDSRGNLVCQRVIDIRRYDVEIMEVMEDLGLPRIPMKRYNVSAKDSSRYRKYYTRESRQHVERYFAEDIDTFKFSYT